MARGRRLTDQERVWRSVTGAQLTRDIVDAGRRLGWLAVHNRPGQGRRPGHWATQMIGDAGEPDVRLVRPPEVIFCEVKREANDELTPDQQRWRKALLSCPGVHYVVVRPSSFDAFLTLLATPHYIPSLMIAIALQCRT